MKLSLQLGLVANQSGISSAVKAASNPSSSSYGKYLSMSPLQSKYGASSSKRNGVINAFKKYGVTPVTYYSWRKKEGLVGRRGRRPSLFTQSGSSGSQIATQVRQGVQAKVRAVMPGIVREEVTNYLNTLFTTHRRPGRPRKTL